MQAVPLAPFGRVAGGSCKQDNRVAPGCVTRPRYATRNTGPGLDALGLVRFSIKAAFWRRFGMVA